VVGVESDRDYRDGDDNDVGSGLLGAREWEMWWL
jgi:hypothetical protein